MRNLKKILALVLALVMSLSLMATAGAAETTSASGDPYAVAKDVLEGLDVIKGNPQGDTMYDKSLTRVEAAALIYRVMTGDVTNATAPIHTDAPFKDIAGNWGAGYISYGYVAGILKGDGAGNFNPNDPVSGYQFLTMLLRAMGYGQHGEFEGTQWYQHTADVAQRLQMLKNVTPTDQVTLGNPASRGLVSELLFQALFKDKVQYNALHQAYEAIEPSQKLADNLEVKHDEGAVIVANEWASLVGTKSLDAGKMQVQLSNGGSRTLDWSTIDKKTGGDFDTGIFELGLSCDIYYKGSQVLYLTKSDDNNVYANEDTDNNKTGIAVGDISDKSSVRIGDGTKYFTNFVQGTTTGRPKNNIRIEIQLTLNGQDGLNNFNYGLTGSDRWTFDKLAEVLDSDLAADNDVYKYIKVIPANSNLSDDQIAVMYQIFRIADDGEDTLGVRGSVYTGTQSGIGATDRSDEMSWAKFEETYIDSPKAQNNTINSVAKGNDLRVIDNNGDGVAEYVLVVEYNLDTIVDKKGDDTFYYRGLNVTGSNGCKPVEIRGYSQAVGDVVVYAKIQGKAYVHEAETVNATIKTVNYRDEYIVDTNDSKYEQSGIGNYTDKSDLILNVKEKLPYTLYLDNHSYVRAYDGTSSYALVTEIYPETAWNATFVQNRNLIAEVVLAGKDEVPQEFKLANSYTGTVAYNSGMNPFLIHYTTNADGSYGWPALNRNSIYWSNDPGINYLQPATRRLGLVDESRGEATVGTWLTFSGISNYGTRTGNVAHSWTNVAEYTMAGDNSIELYTAAADVAGDPTTAYSRDVRDYIRLNVTDAVNSSSQLFVINDSYYKSGTVNDITVRATDNTLFYVVDSTGDVRQFVGYKNLPTLTDEVNHFHAKYAVARGIVNDNYDDERDYNTVDEYWTADVIVIEIQTWGTLYDSVAMIYSNDWKTSNSVRYLQAIDSKLGKITIVPEGYLDWANQWQGYGFYGLSKIKETGEAGIYSATITPIKNNFNSYGIFYGIKRSTGNNNGEWFNANYITVDGNVDIYQDHWTSTGLTMANYADVWKVTAEDRYNEATPLLLNNSADTKVEDDRVIYVMNGSQVGFMVDLTKSSNEGIDWLIDWEPGWVTFANGGTVTDCADLIAWEQTTVYEGTALSGATVKANGYVSRNGVGSYEVNTRYPLNGTTYAIVVSNAYNWNSPWTDAQNVSWTKTAHSFGTVSGYAYNLEVNIGKYDQKATSTNLTHLKSLAGEDSMLSNDWVLNSYDLYYVTKDAAGNDVDHWLHPVYSNEWNNDAATWVVRYNVPDGAFDNGVATLKAKTSRDARLNDVCINNSDVKVKNEDWSFTLVLSKNAGVQTVRAEKVNADYSKYNLVETDAELHIEQVLKDAEAKIRAAAAKTYPDEPDKVNEIVKNVMAYLTEVVEDWVENNPSVRISTIKAFTTGSFANEVDDLLEKIETKADLDLPDTDDSNKPDTSKIPEALVTARANATAALKALKAQMKAEYGIPENDPIYDALEELINDPKATEDVNAAVTALNALVESYEDAEGNTQYRFAAAAMQNPVYAALNKALADEIKEIEASATVKVDANAEKPVSKEDIEDALAYAENKNGTLILDATSGTEVSLSEEAVKAAQEAKVAVSVKTKTGTVVIDSEDIPAAKTEDGAVTLVVETPAAEDIDATKLPSGVTLDKVVIVDIHFEDTKGNEVELKGAKKPVTVTVDVGEKIEDPVVCNLKADGTLDLIDANPDVANGELTFTTTHFSLFTQIARTIAEELGLIKVDIKVAENKDVTVKHGNAAVTAVKDWAVKDAYTFTVEVAEGKLIDSVKVDDTVVDADENGVYTIVRKTLSDAAKAKKDVVIAVTVKDAPTTPVEQKVTVIFDLTAAAGITVKDVTGTSVEAAKDTAYDFELVGTVAEGEVLVVTLDDTDKTELTEKDGKYTIPAEKMGVNVKVTVTLVEDNNTPSTPDVNDISAYITDLKIEAARLWDTSGDADDGSTASEPLWEKYEAKATQTNGKKNEWDVTLTVKELAEHTGGDADKTKTFWAGIAVSPIFAQTLPEGIEAPEAAETMNDAPEEATVLWYNGATQDDTTKEWSAVGDEDTDCIFAMDVMYDTADGGKTFENGAISEYWNLDKNNTGTPAGVDGATILIVWNFTNAEVETVEVKTIIHLTITVESDNKDQ